MEIKKTLNAAYHYGQYLPIISNVVGLVNITAMAHLYSSELEINPQGSTVWSNPNYFLRDHSFSYLIDESFGRQLFLLLSIPLISSIFLIVYDLFFRDQKKNDLIEIEKLNKLTSIIERLQKNPQDFASMSDRNNLEVVLYVQNYVDVYPYIDNKIRNDLTYILRAVKLHPSAVMSAHPTARINKHFMLACVKRNIEVISYLHSDLMQDNDYVEKLKEYDKQDKFITKRTKSL